MNILITGHSHGLGAALAAAHLARGDTVYGLARSALGTPHPKLHQFIVDLSELESITTKLREHFSAPPAFSVVYLNAGVLGNIEPVTNASIDSIKSVMDINVWANKYLLDWCVALRPQPRQIIAISSGAAVNGHRGWNSYALSKASLNMLVQLYAHEFKYAHLTALAPGLVNTAMQDTLKQHDANTFPSLQRLHAAHGTQAMQSPQSAAKRIMTALPKLQTLASGGFVDLREFD